MENKLFKNSALILGMYETGLAVGRSLARKGIKVYGIDHKIDTGFFSKYITSFLCPHPIIEKDSFLEFLVSFSKQFEYPPVLFIAADEFLESFLRNRSEINKYYINNIPSNEILSFAFNKYELMIKAQELKVDVPVTYCFSSDVKPENVLGKLEFPFIIKANNINEWRNKVNSSIKTYLIRSSQDLMEILNKLNNSGIEWLAQEIIPGEDKNHYKFSGYFQNNNDSENFFMLQKIRQYPARFGIGCSVVSVKNEELCRVGLKFFNGMNYNGIGSCEFKYDERDNLFKLIELNARYWQQYSLCERCGVNLAYADFLVSTGENCEYGLDYETGIKWINIHLDFLSFLFYRKEDKLDLNDWLDSLRGKKIFSDFVIDDFLPFLYEIKFGKRFFNMMKLFGP